MVEINNQRKAFLDVWRGRRELITDVRKPEIMVMTSLRWQPHWLLRSPSQTSRLSPKLKSTDADATSFFPVGGMPTANSLAWKAISVWTLRHCFPGRAWRCNVWSWVISVRQSTVAAISGLHCRALVMVSSSMSWRPDCKIQRSGRNGQKIDVSRVAIILRSG